jgi:two-component system sensor histidine kinase AgrC
MIRWLNNISELMTIVFCFHFMFKKKMKADIWTILLGCCDVLLFALIDFHVIDNMYSWLMYLIILLYSALEFRAEKKQVVISNIVYIVIMGILYLWAVLLMMAAGLLIEMNDVTRCILNIMVFLAVILIRDKIHNFFQLVQNQAEAVLVIGIIYVWMLSEKVMRYKDQKMPEINLFAAILVFCSLTCILVYCWLNEKQKAYKAEMNLKAYQVYKDSFGELLDTIRARQHDFHNHIQAIQSMHYMINTYEELVLKQDEYCKTLIEGDENYYILNENWPVLSGFLYSKFKEANQKNIKALSRIQVGIGQYRIPEYILIELVGILIDNAIEETETSENKMFMVRIKEENKKLVIEVANPVSDMSYQDIYSLFKKNKSEKEGHEGLGLYKVDEYSRKYLFRKHAAKVSYKGTDWLFIRLTI